MKKRNLILILILSVAIILSGCGSIENNDYNTTLGTNTIQDKQEKEAYTEQNQESLTSITLEDIPEYNGKAYVVVNNNVPAFTESDLTTTSFEKYSALDSLGRCGVANANIGLDLMPTEERGNIGMVKPSGWQTIRYENVDGRYLYNRCHLIGFQLSGENANDRNLITGTRYMNVEGMLPFENMVADYVQETNNHVLYRVTPIYEGNNLLASGVQMEAYSVEDKGGDICFNVFCYNVQPGIIIDYSNGNSRAEDGSAPYGSSGVVIPEKENNQTQNSNGSTTYIANKNTGKFHYPDCSSVGQMKEKNKKYLTGTRDEAIAQGYSSCGRCNP